jgi:sulfur-carrier protein adenylyltransferase/sulfurtransferase
VVGGFQVSSNPFEITAQELKERLDRGDHLFLLDVREPFEYQICRLPDSKLIPLGEVPARFNELDSSREIIVYCHAGVRSARAVGWLYQVGFTNIKNLIGGIHAWAEEVDPAMPRY